MLVLSMAVLFAETYVQTIVLMSVVEEVEPSFNLEINYVENGSGYITSKNEASIFSQNAREDIEASFSINQSLSRYCGEVEITVSVSELYWNGYNTNGLCIFGNVNEVEGRKGEVNVSENCVRFTLAYSGNTIDDSEAANFIIRYKGDSTLPDETYVSYIGMVIKVK